MKQLMDVNYEVRSLEEDGMFSGYGSIFDIPDAYGDLVARGSFTKSLAEHSRKHRVPAMLWQHRTDEPIGVWTVIREDARGLYTEGRLILETQRGAEAHALLKAGAISGLSIGFNPKAWKFDEQKRRVLTEIDLWETSLVTFPANDEARIGSVKAALRAGQPVRLSDVEEILRREGFSRKQAKGIVAVGIRGAGIPCVSEAAKDKACGLLERIRQSLAGGN